MKTTEKKNSEEIKLQADTLTDLPVTDEQAEKTRGGSPLLMLHCASGQHI
jgi:hypothetical protein